jgi:glucose repression regulatory protein TUP1
LWDVENKRLHHTFVGHELDIYSLDFSKDGRFIVSGSGDKKAKIWDVEKGEVIFHYNDCKHLVPIHTRK